MQDFLTLNSNWGHGLMVNGNSRAGVCLGISLPNVFEQGDFWKIRGGVRRHSLYVMRELQSCMESTPSQCRKSLVIPRRHGFDPCVRKILWRRAWQPTPVFLLGESPWTEKPGRLQSMGSQRDGHAWSTKHSTHCAACIRISHYNKISCFMFFFLPICKINQS